MARIKKQAGWLSKLCVIDSFSRIFFYLSIRMMPFTLSSTT